MAGAMALSIGIAIQNFSEGAIISMLLRSEGECKRQAFLYGVLSGIVEPVTAVLTIWVAGFVASVLPYGGMIYVVVEELIPEISEEKHSKLGTVFFALGFTAMLALDAALR